MLEGTRNKGMQDFDRSIQMKQTEKIPKTLFIEELEGPEYIPGITTLIIGEESDGGNGRITTLALGEEAE